MPQKLREVQLRDEQVVKLSMLQRKILRMALLAYKPGKRNGNQGITVRDILETCYGWPEEGHGPRKDRVAVLRAIDRLADRELVEFIQSGPEYQRHLALGQQLVGVRLTHQGYTAAVWDSKFRATIDAWKARTETVAQLEAQPKPDDHGPWPGLTDEQIEAVVYRIASDAHELLRRVELRPEQTGYGLDECTRNTRSGTPSVCAVPRPDGSGFDLEPCTDEEPAGTLTYSDYFVRLECRGYFPDATCERPSWADEE